MGSRAACMNDPLGNALMVKMGNFFAKNKIFEQGSATLTCLEGVLVVVNF